MSTRSGATYNNMGLRGRGGNLNVGNTGRGGVAARGGDVVRGGNAARGGNLNAGRGGVAVRGGDVVRGGNAARGGNLNVGNAGRGGNAARGGAVRKYCGNNQTYAEQQNLVIGTKYDCLRKGIGFGLHFHDNDDNQDWVEFYNNDNYQKIDNRNFYCGDKPWNEARDLNNAEGDPKYDVEGNLSMCFKKGTGVGLRLAARALVEADGRSVRTSRKSSPRKLRRRRSR